MTFTFTIDETVLYCLGAAAGFLLYLAIANLTARIIWRCVRPPESAGYFEQQDRKTLATVSGIFWPATFFLCLFHILAWFAVVCVMTPIFCTLAFVVYYLLIYPVIPKD